MKLNLGYLNSYFVIHLLAFLFCFLLFTELWKTYKRLIRSVLVFILPVFTLDQNCLACCAHSGQGKLLQICINNNIRFGPIKGKLESLILAAKVCIKIHVLGPQELGDII